MYNNIGQKIKSFVKIIVIISFILVGIVGVITLIADPLAGIIMILVDGFGVWVGGFVLYGLGELIDNSTKIREMMEKETKDKE